MNSYLKSEFYRIFHNMKTYLFIGICSLLLISSNVVLAAVKHSQSNFGYANTYFSLVNFAGSALYIFFLCIMVATMIFGNEHGNHTMKNSISYGISRGTIYFGKLIVEIVYALIAFTVITGVHVASAYVLLEHSNTNEIEILLRACFVSLPLFLFVLATANCFAFIIESANAGFAADVGLVLALPVISGFLGHKFEFFKKLANILPLNMLTNIKFDSKTYQLLLPWAGSNGYYYYWISGITQMLLIIVIGFMFYRKMEIK